MLSFLTEPNYPKAAIGFEKESVTVVSLSRESRGSFGIKQAATIDLPNGLLEPNFLERNISNSREMMVLLDQAVVSAGLAGQKQWSVSLPSNAARSAILTMDSPVSGKDDSEEILDWKAEQSFGAPAAELRITRFKIAPDQDGRSRYFASAVKLSVIDEFETIFEDLGWKVGLILPRAVSESKWIIEESRQADSILISSQSDGFSAVLMRGGEPTVIRTVSCQVKEQDDEIYRLLMFYNDRFAGEGGDKFLDRILLVGRELVPARIREVSGEALGRALQVLRPEEVGLNIPVNSLNFNELAAPAGLATLAWK